MNDRSHDRRHCLARGAASVAVLTLLVFTGVVLQGAPSEAEPTFKNAKGTKTYSEAKALYDKGDYVKARKKFMSAMKLAKSGADKKTVNGWVAASKLQKPQLDKDQMSEVFLKYKGAEAGEIDWRPTETVPEDYYAF